MEEEYIKVKVRQFDSGESYRKGEYVRYKEIVYKFIGYDYGTYPIVEDLETGETITLPHY